MDSIVDNFVKFLSNLQSLASLENLEKQNDLFLATESTKLLMEEDVSSDEDNQDHVEEEGEDGLTGKDVAMGVLMKLAKLFEYTTILDKGILLIGFIFTIVHAACFPIMAIIGNTNSTGRQK